MYSIASLGSGLLSSHNHILRQSSTHDPQLFTVGISMSWKAASRIMVSGKRQGGWERMATLSLLVVRVKFLFSAAWENGCSFQQSFTHLGGIVEKYWLLSQEVTCLSDNYTSEPCVETQLG